VHGPLANPLKNADFRHRCPGRRVEPSRASRFPPVPASGGSQRAPTGASPGGPAAAGPRSQLESARHRGTARQARARRSLTTGCTVSLRPSPLPDVIEEGTVPSHGGGPRRSTPAGYPEPIFETSTKPRFRGIGPRLVEAVQPRTRTRKPRSRRFSGFGPAPGFLPASGRDVSGTSVRIPATVSVTVTDTGQLSRAFCARSAAHLAFMRPIGPCAPRGEVALGLGDNLHRLSSGGLALAASGPVRLHPARLCCRPCCFAGTFVGRGLVALPMVRPAPASARFAASSCAS